MENLRYRDISIQYIENGKMDGKEEKLNDDVRFYDVTISKQDGNLQTTFVKVKKNCQNIQWMMVF